MKKSEFLNYIETLEKSIAVQLEVIQILKNSMAVSTKTESANNNLSDRSKQILENFQKEFTHNTNSPQQISQPAPQKNPTLSHARRPEDFGSDGIDLDATGIDFERMKKIMGKTK